MLIKKVEYKELYSYFQAFASIMVWDADSDTVSNFNFTTGMTDQQKIEAEADAALVAGQRPGTAAARFVLRLELR